MTLVVAALVVEADLAAAHPAAALVVEADPVAVEADPVAVEATRWRL